MAVVVIAIHYQGNTRMPDWLYNIGVLRLSKITLVCVEHLNGVPEQVMSMTSMNSTCTFSCIKSNYLSETIFFQWQCHEFNIYVFANKIKLSM